MARDALGDVEHFVLVALLRLGGESYGVPILEEIAARTSRTVSRPSIYIALRRLEAKGLVRSLLKTAPREFVQYARNPERSVTVGGNNTIFVPVYGPPFIRTLDEGRRYATIEDFRNFVKLAYMSPSLHHSGGTVCEPVDIPVAKRHLDMVYSHIRYSDKPFMGSVTAPERAEDSVTMAKMVFGDEFVDRNCVLTNLINANSPLVFDGTMVGALKVYARANQATVVSPFILSGAMSAVTVVGTLTQILAEASVGMAFAQLCRPGAPVVFGTFASSISMQSGAPTFGTPEPAHVLFGAAQLARRLGVAPGAISVKAKTNEGMGFIGQGEGLAVIAIAVLEAR